MSSPSGLGGHDPPPAPAHASPQRRAGLSHFAGEKAEAGLRAA